jgi:hypothetical protein
MKLKDITRRGTDDDVVRNLLATASRLDDLRNLVPIRPIDDFAGLSVKRLLTYQSKEIRAASLCLRIDIHAFAWRLRNIFEALLLFEHVTKSDTNARAFVAQKIGDEKAVIDGALSLNVGRESDRSPLQARRNKADGVLKKHGFSKVAPWRADQLADLAGLRSDFDALYKLCSKYVHPSAWTILSDEDEYSTAEHWEILVLQVQLYAHQSVGSAEAFLSTRGKWPLVISCGIQQSKYLSS